jgi:3-vinyl bacteriochlorophyllide hydratase
MFTASVLGPLVNAIDCCPFGASAGRHARVKRTFAQRRPHALYTTQERKRRDESAWTVVQGVLAPIQFLVFLISVVLVVRYLLTGDGYSAATFSVIVKTLVLYTIMITGSIWEHEVFGRYLFAPAFFWEDMVSMLVLALHTIYLAGIMTGALPPHELMLIALAGYATYVINAAQFVMKLRAARLDEKRFGTWDGNGGGALEPSR